MAIALKKALANDSSAFPGRWTGRVSFGDNPQDATFPEPDFIESNSSEGFPSIGFDAGMLDGACALAIL